MTYTQARNRLQAVTVRAIQPGLERTRALLAGLGQPDRFCPAIQITGTNGKGSVAVLIASALQAAGYRVGRFTSPHLSDERERIVIQGRMVSRVRFTHAVERLLPALRRLQANGNPATTFEAWTVLAAEIFRASKMEIAVLEVGMGGRLDSTTAWSKVLLSVLTNVSLDHTRELGATKAAICQEKLGIARPGVTMVSAESDSALRRRMHSASREQKFSLLFSGQPQDEAYAMDWQPTASGLRIKAMLQGQPLQLRLGLRGNYQVANAMLAGLAIRQLAATGFFVSDAALRLGFRNAVWPGRLEKIHTRPDIFLEGGHNPGAAAVLAQEWRAQPNAILLVMGVMQDKDVQAMIATLAPVVRQVWTVTPPEKKRALPAAALARLWEAVGRPVAAASSYGAAIKAAVRAAGQTGTIVVVGSLYNIAPARRAVQRLYPQPSRPRL